MRKKELNEKKFFSGSCLVYIYFLLSVQDIFIKYLYFIKLCKSQKSNIIKKLFKNNFLRPHWLPINAWII
jgi:hypothetical protein